MLDGLDAVPLDRTVLEMAELLVRERLMPGPAAAGDAVHLAASVIHRMDYLLTWNQKHLANPNKRTHLMVVCARLNLTAPQIVTPDLLVIQEDEA